ncbi:putative integral membrane protein (TIGR00698 family) [Pseudoduganella flava]|nr:putative sulfate exporter family transporter [Pseudoduganella flava]TWI42179.1 putative integral membrane protein (TIGR00698 family) [Pseudoduganella flava]
MNDIKQYLPGLALCAAVTLAATALGHAEALLLGRAWLEPLVLAILLGSLLRTARPLPAATAPGIHLGAKTLLEVAVLLLGATVDAHALARPALAAGIAGSVLVAIAFSYAVCRALRLPHRLALLIACGNSICGNSAIAAVAPVIDAEGGEVAASIAFTAVLGVAVVLLLPPLGRLLGQTPLQYGVFAGMTVYAVPQVLAAAGPVSATSLQAGTVVKLLRVLMLGPVVLLLSLAGRGGRRVPLAHMVPWFIVGFLALMAARSAGLLPAHVIAAAHGTAGWLTAMSMAALGLGVDARAVLRAGARVSAAVIVSLAGLAAISLALIRLLGV